MPEIVILGGNNEFKDPKIGLFTPKTFGWSEVSDFSATSFVEQALLTGHEDAISSRNKMPRLHIDLSLPRLAD
jgi:hypothetical protein